MKKNRTGEIPLFIKYIVSYLTVLIIPLLILGLFVSSRTFSVLEKVNISLNRSRLYTLMESVQTQMDHVIQFYVMASSNPLLTRKGSDFSPSEVMEIFRTLEEYKLMNSYFNEIILIPETGDSVYLSDRKIAKKDFTDVLDQVRFSNEGIGMNILPSFTVGGKKSIAFILPFPIYESNIGVIIFLLEDDAVTGHMNRLTDDDSTAAAIFDAHGESISFSNYPDSIGPVDIFPLINLNFSEGNSSIDLHGSSYLLSWIHSPEFRWTYTMLTPEEVVMDSSQAVGRIFVFSVLFIMFIEFFLIAYLLKLYYFPLRRLKEQAEETLGRHLDSGNELKAMMNALDIMSEEKTLSVPARREFLLFNTLKGRVASREEFNLKGREIGLIFTHKLYVVAVLHFSDLSDSRRNSLFQWINQMEEPDIDAYVKDPLNELNFIFLISLDSYEKLEYIIPNLKKEILKRYELNCSVGIGRAYDDIKSLSKSYLEASTALNYRMIKGHDSIVYFDEIVRDSGNFNWYSKEDLKPLHFSIKRGDLEAVNSIISKLVGQINNSAYPLFVAKSFAYDILYTVLNTIEEMGYANTLPFYPDGVILDHFDSIDDLSNMMLELCSETCKLLMEKDKGAFPELREQLLSYVEEHYLDPDFYAQSMAENFSLSTSYLSQYFKNAVGENLKDYVYRLKIGKAKELLEETDMAIKDIVTEVGYQNVSSFGRKFKFFMGKSPNEYRAERRKREDS